MPTGPLTDPDWQLIVDRIHDEQCLPFLGAGASLGNGSGLPTAYQLADALAEKCKYPGEDKSDLFRVAQYYQMKFDSYGLRSFVRDKILRGTTAPTAVHTMIAELPFRNVITTNFDKLMERAFESAQKTPQVALYKLRGDKADVPLGTVNEPLLYKLHGTVEQLDTMIVTEDDVVEFLACAFMGEPPLPPSLKALFTQNSILFIGYGLKDWNIRVLLRAFRGQRPTASSDKYSFAIQRRPPDLGLAQEWETCVMYWDKKENLRCFDMDAVEFATELCRQYKNYHG
jgi:hypothetical protein